jgi:HD-GYP domain-containing protein (c-di-GMP phosphodiesterase class II)
VGFDGRPRANRLRILKSVDGFGEIALIVRHHHERWDGTGYPDKLAGTNIPAGSRIIALADSIDAMLSDRPYRRALTSRACRAQIAKYSGVMYDPDAAKAALENWALFAGYYCPGSSAD